MKRCFRVAALLICLLACGGCQWFAEVPEETRLKEKATMHLGLTPEDVIYLEGWDTHGGFHGDGEAFVKLSCADGFADRLGSEWRPLPLEGEAYRYFYEWGGVFEHPETNERVIPEVTHGYWCFKNTGPANWEFALFDCDESILYFYQFDS